MAPEKQRPIVFFLCYDLKRFFYQLTPSELKWEIEYLVEPPVSGWQSVDCEVSERVVIKPVCRIRGMGTTSKLGAFCRGGSFEDTVEIVTMHTVRLPKILMHY